MNMRANLESVLDGVRGDLEAGLAEAEAELAQLDERRAELTALIARARAALGLDSAQLIISPSSNDRLTLHGAMAQVLRERDNAWTSARELADEVNGRRLYVKRDGGPVEVNQVHARVKNYPTWFEKNGSQIRLLEGN